MHRYQQLHQLLLDIEAEMRAWSLWTAVSPSPEALSSQQPFCVDTMNFWEWVQWLMLPRFQVMIDSRQPLPNGSNMLPMAEQALLHSKVKSSKLLDYFAELDQLLSVQH